MLVAIPITEDESKIFKRTGRAPYFGVYDVDIKSRTFKFVKKIVNGHSHEEHHEHEDHTEEEIEDHRRYVKELSGCDYLLALALGPNMSVALERENIKTVVYKKSNITMPSELIEMFIKEQMA